MYDNLKIEKKNPLQGAQPQRLINANKRQGLFKGQSLIYSWYFPELKLVQHSKEFTTVRFWHFKG